MRPSQASAILPILLASCAFAALEKRQTNDAVGTIISPANGSSITPGTPFSFQYSDGWGGACHPAYTPISVGITAYRPTWPDLNGSIFKLPDSDYLYYFGDYVILNDEGMQSI
ncbi:hypothetical protein PHLCEN_2v5930 [Hermanssonia centrifuga]|uniref:Uncharacterized protein n=1 Tax=Hermanssonia centrifuga TaxID=98765 RepID=A0A2R6P0V6_9APHY|nr:hypothetical protein PHLCEN_2v5930 [Hermanssonia centrifuga]